MISIIFSLKIIHVYFILITAGKAYAGAVYGLGTGPIALSNVQCDGSSNKLLECRSDKILSSSCAHDQDVGVGGEGEPPSPL